MIKIGDKVNGFKFGDDAGVNYVHAMDKYVGKCGIVHSIYGNVSFNIFFEDNRYFTYPIVEYLVLQREEKLKELGI